jgi:hypothetical protein
MILNKNTRLLLLLLIFPALIWAQQSSDAYRIAVFDLRVEGNGLSDAEGRILARSIRSGLSQKTKYTNIAVLETEEMARLLSGHMQADRLPEVYDASTAIEFGKILQANYAIFGSVTSSTFFDGHLLSSRIVDIESGEIITAYEININDESNYPKSINSTCDELLSVCGVEVVKEVENSSSILAEKIGEVLNNFTSSKGVFRSGNSRSAFSDNRSSFDLSFSDPLSNDFSNKLSQLPGISSEEVIIGGISCQDYLIALGRQGLYYTISDSYGDQKKIAGAMSWLEFSEANISLDHKKIVHQYRADPSDPYDYDEEEIEYVNYCTLNSHEIPPPPYSCKENDNIVFSMLTQIQGLINKDE